MINYSCPAFRPAGNGSTGPLSLRSAR